MQSRTGTTRAHLGDWISRRVANPASRSHDLGEGSLSYIALAYKVVAIMTIGAAGLGSLCR